MILIIYILGIIINFIFCLIYYRGHYYGVYEVADAIFEALTPLGALFKCILSSIFWPVTVIILIIYLPLALLLSILDILAAIVFDMY